ncbi:MAG: hypothetical protein WB679_14235 [Terracidiphilus sp.]
MADSLDKAIDQLQASPPPELTPGQEEIGAGRKGEPKPQPSIPAPDELREQQKQIWVHGKTSDARAAGYSWDAINQHLAERQQTALAAGYTPGEVAAHLGYRMGPLHDRLMISAQRALANA